MFLEPFTEYISISVMCMGKHYTYFIEEEGKDKSCAAIGEEILSIHMHAPSSYDYTGQNRVISQHLGEGLAPDPMDTQVLDYLNALHKSAVLA